MTHKRYQFVCQREKKKENEMYTDNTEVEQKTLCVVVVFVLGLPLILWFCLEFPTACVRLIYSLLLFSIS